MTGVAHVALVAHMADEARINGTAHAVNASNMSGVLVAHAADVAYVAGTAHVADVALRGRTY